MHCDQNLFRRGVFTPTTPIPPPDPVPPPPELGHIQTITFDGNEGQVAFSGGSVWPITADKMDLRFIIREP